MDIEHISRFLYFAKHYNNQRRKIKIHLGTFKNK